MEERTTASAPSANPAPAAAPVPAAAANPAPVPAPAAEPTKADAPSQTPAPAAAPAAQPPKPEPKPAAESPAPKGNGAAEKSPEVVLLEGKIHALSAGVKPEAADDVLTLAKADVKEGVTLEQAIDGVLERYPSFRGAAPPSITSSAPTGNDEARASDDAFVNRIMGIK